MDAVEIMNSGLTHENDYAKDYTRKYGLLETGGSDLHSFKTAVLSGVETAKPCLTVHELITAIKEKKADVFKISV